MKGYLKNLLLLPALLLTDNIISQPLVCKLASEIVDTNLSAYGQAQQLYNWITENMRYDVKSLRSYNPNETDVNVIIKKQKGVCYEFAYLFAELCECRNIPAEIVPGYSKGLNFYPGKDFTRSIHAWNILKPDSVWILADPTWGSGYVYLKTGMLKKIAGMITGKPALANKYKFRREPDPGYFNISPDSLIRTHLPLNPLFQLKNPAVSYQAFIRDSVSASHFMIDPLKNLEQRDHYASAAWYLDDARSGKSFNRLNNFDLSNASLAYAVSLYQTIPQNPDSNKKNDLQMIYSLADSSLKALGVHSLVNDSLYKERRKFLSENIKSCKKLDARVNKDRARYKSLAKRKKVSQVFSRLMKTEGKKIAVENKIEKLQSTGFPELTIEGWEPDSSRLAEYRRKVMADSRSLDSLMQISLISLHRVDTTFADYISVNDSLSASRRYYLSSLNLGELIIKTNNEKLINGHIQALSLNYLYLQQQYIRRVRMYNQFLELYSSNIKIFNDIEKHGKESLKLLRDSYSKTYDAFHLAELDSLKFRLENSYNNNISLIDSYISFRQSDLKVKKSDKGQIRIIRKYLKKDIKFFVAYYENAMERNDNEKKQEKYIAGLVRDEARSLRSQTGKLMVRSGK